MTLIDFALTKLLTPKTWSDKLKKVHFQTILRQATWETYPSPGQICITASLSHSLITAISIELEKVIVFHMPNLGTAC